MTTAPKPAPHARAQGPRRGWWLHLSSQLPHALPRFATLCLCACTQIQGHQPILPAFLQSNAQANADYQRLSFEASLSLAKSHLYALGLDCGCSSHSHAPGA